MKKYKFTDSSKKDCRYYLSYKPCKYYKMYLSNCNNCSYYNRFDKKILLIKFGAKGDVLRTTSFLPTLKEKYKSWKIIWLTGEGNKELLYNITYIDEVIEYTEETLPILLCMEFDLVFNLDVTKLSSSLATLIKVKKRIGFGLDKDGFLYPFNAEALAWLKMSLDDSFKKRNKKTYQCLMSELMKIPYKRIKPLINLTQKERGFAEKFAKRNKIERGNRTVGIIPGAGSRWKLKNWPIEKYIQLIKKIKKTFNVNIIIYGDREEKEILSKIKKICPFVINSGWNNSIREFMSLVNLCDLFITPDTLGLHVALGLNKYIIVLFGPTSSNEVDLFDNGVKIIPKKSCISCYKEKCDEKITCMDKISIDEVFFQVSKWINSENKLL